MKSRKLGIALLVMLAFVVTSGTFAYWASSVTGPDATDTTGTVTIGSGNAVTTSFSFTSGTDSNSLLVPSGMGNGTTTFDTLPLSYELQWLEDAGTFDLTGTTTTGTLNVSVSVVVIDDDGLTDVTATVGSLINVTAVDTPAAITLGAAAASYSFNVTMDMPADQAEYDLLAGSEIQITFTWSITGVTTTDNA